MSGKKKVVVGIICLVAWVGGVNYLDRTVPKQSSNSASASVESTPDPVQDKIRKCQQVRAEGERLDNQSAALVEKARSLQMVWIKREMTRLHETGKISDLEWQVFSDYVDVGDGTPKIPLGAIDTLMKKIVNAGYIKPYLPKEVVDVGTLAATSPRSSNYLVKFPECFDALEFSVIKSMAELPPVKGVWGNRLENPIQLIP